jgi:hypothetical protein
VSGEGLLTCCNSSFSEGLENKRLAKVEDIQKGSRKDQRKIQQNPERLKDRKTP